MLRTCVIGGAGFIGSYIVELLLSQGRKVTVVGRSQRPVRILPDEVLYYSGDYGNGVFLRGILQEMDEVISLAHTTVPKTSYDDPVSDILGNLPAVVTLFETAVLCGTKRVVFVSSGGTIYGNAKELPITEGVPTNPISPYGITKLAMEKYAFMYHVTHNLPVICVRPGNAYGPGQIPFSGQGLVATVAASILSGEEILSYGAERTIRDYLHVRDIASGIVAALERGRPGECYNIGNGIGRSTREVITAIVSCGRNEGHQAAVRELLGRSFDVSANVLDSRKLMADTGWSPEIDFDSGISETWRWYADNVDRNLLCS